MLKEAWSSGDQGSEREWRWEGQGGYWGLQTSVGSPGSSASHPGGVLVREPASPDQEGGPGGGRTVSPLEEL